MCMDPSKLKDSVVEIVICGQKNGVLQQYWLYVGDKQSGNLREGGSVTRLGDLLDFGQLFKAFGNN